MTHIGIICPSATGHLNPTTNLGYELRKRGHKVTLFGIADTQSNASSAGLDFWMLGYRDYPLGSIKKIHTQLGKLKGLSALQYTLNCLKQEASMRLIETPEAFRKTGVEGLLIDQACPDVSTVAEHLKIPFVTISNALILNQESIIPPPFTAWQYSSSWTAQLRNNIGYVLSNRIGASYRKVIDEYRRQWNLKLYSRFDDSNSPYAQLSQQPAEFEFPRTALPKNVHFTGPYYAPITRKSIDFPFEKLTGQPLIYASLGTVQNQLVGIFNKIAEACLGMDTQLIISLGGAMKPETLGELPGNPIVVEYAPQLELLEKATLTITHAGLNTTLESLSNGVPMVAIPIANDQPGVAARIAWTETGEVVHLNQLSVSKLKTAITKVLTENSYKKNALRLQQAIHKAGGVTRAANIVEQVITTRKPVYK